MSRLACPECQSEHLTHTPRNTWDCLDCPNVEIPEIDAERAWHRKEQEELLKTIDNLENRIGELERQLEMLHGKNFSERTFQALTSRAETAEAQNKELIGVLEKTMEELQELAEGEGWPLGPDTTDRNEAILAKTRGEK